MAYWGDTAIRWAWTVSEIIYFSKLEVSHEFHEDIIVVAWVSVNRHYSPELPLQEFRKRVQSNIKDFQKGKMYIKPEEVPDFIECLDLSSYGLREQTVKVVMKMSELVLFTNTYSPHCERMRKDAIDGLYSILVKHSDEPIDKEKYWMLVRETITNIQAGTIERMSPDVRIARKKNDQLEHRSIESLFDINREHPKS